MVPRLLVLAATHTYRLEAFAAAARRVGVALTVGVDVPPAHTASTPDQLRLDFRAPERCVAQAKAWALQHPVQAVLATDDATVTLAAQLSEELDLPHNALEAAEISRNKFKMRQAFAAQQVPSPWFRLFNTADDPTQIAAQVRYPCVLKPTCLAGSRGVMRANDPVAFGAAWERLGRILRAVPSTEVLVEGYLPGEELALEGLLLNGQLQVLALFDKPDPLEGPFFEETIYVTPSRQPVEVQAAIAREVARAAAAVGLREGALHAEVRVAANGSVWLLEVAGRSIGGLCAKTLRFAQTGEVTLEELLVRQAVGLPLPALEREAQAGGVMMIPIPQAGTLLGVQGEAAARAVPLIESVEITAPLHYPLVPLPEGDSYLGFIFARGPSPAAVEAALRTAHQCLRFEVEAPLL